MAQPRARYRYPRGVYGAYGTPSYHRDRVDQGSPASRRQREKQYVIWDDQPEPSPISRQENPAGLGYSSHNHHEQGADNQCHSSLQSLAPRDQELMGGRRNYQDRHGYGAREVRDHHERSSHRHHHQQRREPSLENRHHHRHHQHPTQEKHSQTPSSVKEAGKAAFAAAAIKGVTARRDPRRPLRAATAAAGAAAIDYLAQERGNRRHHVRHVIEGTIGGLVLDRLVNPRTRR